ncbi:MAG: tRNA (adenosine(37)-N6)-threonylcarbamoyltransferase complex dimerization subunit type 1 TsaB [Phycisphaeraceae bacterium]
MVDAWVLAIETSGRRSSVALGRATGDAGLEVREVARSRRHNLELLPTVAALCRERGVTAAELSAVVVSLGPGSFTGLRVGVAAAQMLGLTTSCELVGVPTIEALACNIPERLRREPVAVCLGSKRGWTYAAVYAEGVALQPPRGVTFDELLADPAAGKDTTARPTALLGERLREQLDKHATVDTSSVECLEDEHAEVRVEHVFTLGLAKWQRGETQPPERLRPIYGREPEAVRLWRQRSTT